MILIGLGNSITMGNNEKILLYWNGVLQISQMGSHYRVVYTIAVLAHCYCTHNIINPRPPKGWLITMKL